MNGWQALVEIVKSFNERGSVTLGFAAFCLAVAAIVAVAMVIGYQTGAAATWLGGLAVGYASKAIRHH